MTLTKEDWQRVLKNNEDDKNNMMKAYELSMPQFDTMIDFCKKKIAEFPEEAKDDPMPEEVKKMLGDAVQ